MKTVLKASDVRREWSRFIDEVKWVKPALVKRNRDIVSVLSLDLLEFILEEYKLTVEVKKEADGSYTGICLLFWQSESQKPFSICLQSNTCF